MHLAEFLDLRPVPAAGVALSVTGRCPLGCAHCSTGATPRSPEPPRAALLSFAASFARAPHPPSVALLTGGEPLLRPVLVRELAARCRAAGTATMLLTGLPFGRRGPVPPPRVAAALAAVDHVSISLDPFHELRVPRATVFAVLRMLLDAGTDVSLHLLAAGPHDAYPDGVAAAVRREFGERVPMLVGRLAAVGRARSLPATGGADAGGGREVRDAAVGTVREDSGTAPSGMRGVFDALRASTREPADVAPGDGREPLGMGPCAVAAWPAVGPDGVIRACSNQDVVDGRTAAPHLRLGTVGRDGWAAVRERTLASPVLQAVRTLGAGSCARCQALRGGPDRATAARTAALEVPVARLQARAGAVGFARRYGSPRHADLVLLGAESASPRGTERPPCDTG